MGEACGTFSIENIRHRGVIYEHLGQNDHDVFWSIVWWLREPLVMMKTLMSEMYLKSLDEIESSKWSRVIFAIYCDLKMLKVAVEEGEK